ncbi:hypothetical protein KP509_02G082700 [Ceratopteris richardii]|uniref:Uncharacterized protein n=1 Tax=Ceratopteris richardii TaxID=49495 RepID=A0A8T2VEX3_CERRI|nr:hypothetical protein KP509_02G082700 [Ceratopteris richardii]
MAQKVLLLALLLVISCAVFQGNEASNVCPLFCFSVHYITCKSARGMKFPAECNCCLFRNSHSHEHKCQLHLTDGTVVKC